jgi:hypothetical protein
LLTAATFDFIEQLDGQTEIASLIEGCQDLIGKFGLHCFMVGDPNQPNYHARNGSGRRPGHRIGLRTGWRRITSPSI